jgi:alkylation response protein AidB-like acyl-CoA dehydrogenase
MLAVPTPGGRTVTATLPKTVTAGEIGTASVLLDAARALRPLVEASADEIERERRLPEPLVEAMASAGLLTMLVPRGLGGGQVDPETFLRVIEEVSRSDASTGWCLNQGVLISLAAGSLREGTATEIWGDDPRAFVAGTAIPSGTAVVVDGGYRVSGRWAFASGCQHATWILGVVNVVQDGAPRLGSNGVPETRFVFFPRSACQILDTWHVAGLRGTGSHDFVVEDVFVPARRTHPRSDWLPPRDGSPLYVFSGGQVPSADPARVSSSPWTVLTSPGMAAVTVGIARGALDAFADLAAVKIPSGRVLLLRDEPTVQASVGRAEAKLRAARAFLYETVEEAWRAVQETGSSSSEGRALMRLASAHASETAADVVETVWKAAGTAAIVDGSPLDRRLRDVLVVGQNLGVTPTYFGMVGKLLLGAGTE